MLNPIALNLTDEHVDALIAEADAAHARIAELEAALRTIVEIGESHTSDDPHGLWLVAGNMQGEAQRVLNRVPLKMK